MSGPRYGLISRAEAALAYGAADARSVAAAGSSCGGPQESAAAQRLTDATGRVLRLAV